MPVRTIVMLAATLALVGAASGSRGDVASDVRTLVSELERVHPAPYHSISREAFGRAADELAGRAPRLSREQAIVETMRLLALLGEREGHGGLLPVHDGHRVPLHAFPWRLWRFPEGFYVLQAADRSLVGARLVAVDGVPIADVEARVRPLVMRDNESSRTLFLGFYLVSAEVLRGLEITKQLGSASFTVVTRTGAQREVTLAALTVPQYERAVPFRGWLPAPDGMPRRRQPLYQRLSRLPYGITPLRKGRALYVAYNQTTYAGLIPTRLLRLARSPKVRRVILDLRLNGGGDNTSYGSLLGALRSRSISRKLVVLTSRVTFSAAGNLAADIDRSTRARFVGEATGGSPNNYGDVTEVALPALGVSVHLSTSWVEAVPGDTRVTIEPDRRVPLTAAAFFAGRDPVLAAALR
jgi:hypothetical protein